MYQGRKCNVDYACRLNGKKPAKEFIESMTEKERIKLQLILRMRVDKGRVSNEQKFKKLEGPIWELKSDKIRVLCFQDGKCWVLTNGFRKDTRKTRRKYIELAKTIMVEHKAKP